MALDILIVDDSAAIRKILQRVLMQADVAVGTVYEASDGAEAIEKLKTASVGLILSDINMPNMDGIEMLSRIRAQEIHRNTPIIMISTEGSQAKVLQALELGASGYVRKPFTAEQIKEKLTGLV
ncbi:MAG: response regulator [Bryobacteraceae bacterium]